MSDVDFGAIAASVTDRLESGIPAPDPEPAAIPDLAPAADAPVTPVAEAPAPVDADVYDDATVQTFDRDYVTKLRDKEARYRTERNEERERWAEWNKTLDGLDPDQQGLARELVSSILQGDLARATEIIGPDALAEVLGAAPAVAAEPASADAPLTRADLQRELEQREAAQAKQRDMDAVFDQAKKLGYNPTAERGTPEFGRWVMLVQHAEATGSLEAGHKALAAAEAAHERAIIDRYISKASSNGSPAPAAPGSAASREPEGAWLETGNPLQSAMRRAMDRVSGDHPQIG